MFSGGGGALVFEVGYHPHKNIHIIRVVFQDKAMYAPTSFRGSKTNKIGKKANKLYKITLPFLAISKACVVMFRKLFQWPTIAMS